MVSIFEGVTASPPKDPTPIPWFSPAKIVAISCLHLSDTPWEHSETLHSCKLDLVRHDEGIVSFG